MVKTRLIPVLYIMNGLIVRSQGFSLHQNIGNVINQAQRYNEWDVDELIYIDISREAGHDLRRSDHRVSPYHGTAELIQRIGSVCFMPLTVGGGIRSVEDAELRLRNGADKITLNSAALARPALIGEIASRYGSQCVVISVDYRVAGGKALVYSGFGRDNTGMEASEWARRCADAGAGEILLTAIDRDGEASGYDLANIAAVVSAVDIPVIACGGAAEFYDFVEVVKETGASAVAAGNIFHFTERSYPRAKQLMKREGINVRS